MVIREAEERDIDALGRVKEWGGAAHRDRVLHGPEMPIKLLVAEENGEVIGYSYVLLSEPSFWKPRYVPQIVDLQVREDCRNKGFGTALVHASEELIRKQGGKAIYLAVDPDNNPRALALYRRLGYLALDDHPIDELWEFTDSSGYVHSGLDHVIYMRKDLKF